MPAFWSILAKLTHAYTIVLIVDIVLSWIQLPATNPLVQLIKSVTEPVYRRIRGMIPTRFGGLDFAPLILILALHFLRQFFVSMSYR